MYKIFFEKSLLFLLHESEIEQLPTDPKALVARYTGKQKVLGNYIDNLEKECKYSYIALTFRDLDQLKDDFFDLFEIVPAAGGLVFNAAQESLFIYRRGAWDLPKGKIENGETNPVAALREVEEETGLICEILTELPTTYHTYKHKGKRVLKPTFWYKMNCKDTSTLKLQYEEDIEDSMWLAPQAFMDAELPFYSNLKQVVEAASMPDQR